MNQQAYDALKAQLQEQMKSNPHAFTGLLDKADAYKAQGNYEEATALFNMAREIDSSCDRAWQGRYECLNLWIKS